VPNVHRYFMVGDTCSACHQHPAGVSTWVDMWVGGNGSDDAAVLSCENALTGNHAIVRDPVAGLPVVAGSLFNGANQQCSAQYGDS
jgi:hypothetical protein